MLGLQFWPILGSVPPIEIPLPIPAEPPVPIPTPIPAPIQIPIPVPPSFPVPVPILPPEPVNSPGPNSPSPPQGQPPTSSTPCACKLSRVPPVGGNQRHDDYAASLQGGRGAELRVVTPNGLSAQFDAGVVYDTPTIVYEAKTAYAFMNRPNVSRKILDRMADQFANEAVVARTCQLRFIIAVDNQGGATGIRLHFPGYDVRYIPYVIWY